MTALKFLSTPSARRATRCGLDDGQGNRISIHALREEGDYGRRMPQIGFSQFLSTPSARRATGSGQASRRQENQNFYPRPPRGGRLFGPAGWPLLDAFLSTPSARRATDFVPVLLPEELISIHALREEGDGSM